ncbi:Uncharacterized protein, contains PIN domain [Auraticoccus monumenti]|uniref:Ribonuclease VapC n=2 Tax=Auraticoccus monumenti TaxID=675864 RepID=A0A1G6TDA6_9ACTN|nr:Uncharacterized protein, contains PIN domain [Auraticoccus monumenti]
MILDTSAIVAVLQGAPEAEQMAAAIEDADRVRISAATLVEASLVLGPTRQDLLDAFVEVCGAEVVAVDAEQAGRARTAHLVFGRGSGSPARLNYGDCFSYALAATTGEALLFKGQDFIHTDLRVALAAGDD